MNLKYFILFLTLSKVSCSTPAAIGTAAMEAIGLISSVITIGIAAKDSMNEFDEPDKSTDTYAEFKKISNKISELESKVYAFNTNYMKILLSHELSNKKEKYDTYISKIRNFYDETKKWSQKLKKNKTLFLVEESERMISPYMENYPRDILFKISELFFKNKNLEKITLLENYENIIKRDIVTMCDMKLSPQHQLFSLYNEIVYNEAKSFAVMSFAYMWRIKFIGHNYTEEIQDLEKTITRRINKYTKLFKNKLQVMPNFVRRCDPIKQQKDLTYAGFDNLVYAFVTNQKNFEPKNKETCKKFCGEIVKSTPKYEKKTICQGKITGCKNDASYEVCERQKNDSSSARNYHWIKNKDNKVYYGNANKACTSTKSIDSTSFISWLPYQISWMPSFAATNCRSCLCQCVDDRLDTNNKTIRAFSYMWSNTSDDMVATGARLVAQDRMIHIQLREAKLLPLGKINVTSERWVPLPKFKYQKNFPSMAIYPDGTQILLKEGRDFGVAKFNHTKICLQKLNIDDGYLLSAVRFNDFGFIKSKNCVSLDAKFVKFNYSSGNISSDVYQWAPPLRQPPQLTELIINRPDDPLKFKPNVQDSMNNQYIKIGVTDMIKDASQTTIPFFDLQEVTTKPSAPISAIELIHKGHGSSGGFISLKIHLIDLSFFMDLQSSPKTTIEQTSYLNTNNIL